MLILAGVSLNAIVGDNGIITNAQNANFKNSIAVLEEFLQEKYVENYESMADTDSKLQVLQKIYADYFYSPNKDSGIGGLDYVVDSEGHALYLIKKSGLPDEIRKQLIGGDAGNVPLSEAYTKYQTLSDVYGVTNDLTVYYSSGEKNDDGTNIIMGADIADLDKDNPTRTVLDSNLNMPLYNMLISADNDGDGKISAEESKSVKTITLNSKNKLNDLKDLYSFNSLEALYLESAQLNSFDGIENCSKLYYIYCKNSIVNNYSAIGKLGNRLRYLYFYDIDDQELNKICSKNIGIGSYKLNKLEYLSFSGSEEYINNIQIYNTNYYSGNNHVIANKTATKTITNLIPLKELDYEAKKYVKYLTISCNSITSLDGLQDFSSLILLRAEKNLLTNLHGIENLTNLEILSLYNNNLSELTNFVTGSKLKQIGLAYNKDLITLKGLDNSLQLEYIFAKNCNLGYSIENSTNKNANTDALTSISSISTLKWIDFNDNSNLVWIDYLNDDCSLFYLRLTGCNNLEKNGVLAKRNVILNSTKLYIPEQYSFALLSEDTIELNLANLEILKEDFELIKDYNKIQRLNLKDIKIMKRDSSDSSKLIQITDKNELKESFSLVLNELNNMKFLNLYGCSAIDDISFVNDMNDLRELDIRNTSITDLSILEVKRNNNTMKLGCLGVNVTGTDLSTIPNTISSLFDYNTDYWNFIDNTRHGGVLCDNSDVWNTLNGSDITKFKIHSSSSGNCDLSSCTSLESVHIESQARLILPNSVKTIRSMNCSAPFLADGTNLIYAENFGAPGFNAWMSCFSNCSEIKKFDCSYSGYGNFSLLQSLEGKGLESLKINQSGHFDGSGLKLPSSLKIFEYSCTNGKITDMPNDILSENGTSLTNLKINYAELTDASFINNLSSLVSIDLGYNKLTSISCIGNDLPNLNELFLNNNNIVSLKNIETFSSISTLKLNNNLISDTSAYKENDGTVITYNNLQILVDMHPSKGIGNLKKIYISNNSNIINMSTLKPQGIKWDYIDV